MNELTGVSRLLAADRCLTVPGDLSDLKLTHRRSSRTKTSGPSGRLSQPMNHVSHSSLDARNRLRTTNCYVSAVEVVFVLAIRPAVKVANDEHAKRTWAHRSCNRNSATLVLTKRQVARRMDYVLVLIGSVVKSNWKANQSTRCDVPIQLILLVQGRRILNSWQTGAWEIREPVLRQPSVRLERILEK